MNRALLVLPLLVALVAPARAAAPTVHVSAACTPADKPGRVRCRAVIELPLDHPKDTRITWAELRVLGGDPTVTPLRGRLGILDSETRDGARVVWSFSVAAAAAGERTFRARLLASVRSGDVIELTSHTVDVPVRVAP